MQEFAIADHEPSLLPDGKWTMVWNDEFDGTELDRTKWDYRLCMMGKRHPAWTDKGVHLDGKSHAVFTVLEEDGRPDIISWMSRSLKQNSETTTCSGISEN